MNWQDRFQQLNRLLLNGEINAFNEALNRWVPRTKAEKRAHLHYQGLREFHSGRVAECARLLEKALQEYGENVNLVRDLAVCHYHEQNMQQFRFRLDQLERGLVEFESRLSARTLLECELLLGKFLEAEGRLAPALIYYKRALPRAENPHQRTRVQLQKARWHALYEMSAELSADYRELISIPAESITRDLRIEYAHSMMLIELRLIGADHAWSRYLKTEPECDELDRRLLLFDFIEGSLAMDLPLDPAVSKKIKDFRELDPFEEFLCKMVQGRLEGPTKIEELNDLSSKLPWANYLRLLCLAANREVNPQVKRELNRKLQLILQSLDAKSRDVWNARLKQALHPMEIKLEFCPRSRSISVLGKTVDLSKKKIGQNLLSLLTRRSVLSVEETIQHLWQCDFTPEHYHRLRMGIHRLNMLVFETCGHGKIIEVDSQQVRLRPEIKLEEIDLGLGH